VDDTHFESMFYAVLGRFQEPPCQVGTNLETAQFG
jgi:hypothetical protein